jgi:iron complex outermembrane receptor protein
LKPSIDIYGSLSSKIAARVNATFEQANSFREGVSSQRVYVNPSLLFKWSDKTELLVEGDYLEDNRTPDFGSGIINYRIVDIPRDRFLGVAWSYMNQNQSSITATLTHRLTEQWTLKAMAGIRNNGFDLFSNARPNAGSFVSEDGRWIRNLQKANARENYGLAQLDLTGNIQIGTVRHQLLIGADSDYFNTITNAYNQYMRYDTINVFRTINYTRRSDQPGMSPFTTTTAPINRMGIYAQDLVHITKKIKLLAGLRYSYQQTTSEVYTFSSGKTTISNNFDGAFSPRLGLVLQPSMAHSIFASYSNSFALNSGVDINNNALAPSLIDQYELGIKNELFSGMLSANITAYRILNNNLAQNSLINASTYSYVKELVGSVQSEGIEIDLSTKPVKGFSLTGGYSYNETKYVKSNTYIEGSLLRYNPNHTANIGLSFRRNGFQAALTSVYIGERFAGRSTRVAVVNDAYRLIELPAYLQADLSLAYQVKSFAFRTKIANLGDVLSFNVHDDNSVNPIAPRNFSLSLTFIF